MRNVNPVKAPFVRFIRAPPSEEFLSARRMCRLMWSSAGVVGIIGRNGAGKSTLQKDLVPDNITYGWNC